MDGHHCHHHHGRGAGHIVGMVVGGVVLAVVFGFVFGYFVRALWNWLMPGLFGLKMITYWQAFGLVLLARLLLGGHGHPGHGHHGPRSFRGHCHPGSEEWSDDYESWWKAEGHEAFRRYVERLPKEGESSDRDV